ncbi:MAG: 1-acyl-sn-glycerol-3-phosphate acyltransferase [Ardenticatenaceae bacterium]|nr:1-acyl-sn-glycerol-3-phosphate acyltransferase [Ardenticatenaceae bacterium]
MSITFHVVNFTFKRLVRIMCRVDDSQWHKFPDKGPLLLAANHVNFMEVPAMYTHLMPRPVTGFVKAENWEKPFLRWLFTLWGGIPLHRGEADMTAVRAGLAVLEKGWILTVAPEGTRTGDGRLRQGHPGIVIMALKSGAPILPVAYWGHEQFWQNAKRLRRTEFNLQAGRPFTLDPGNQRVTKEIRQQMADEIMFQIARLLPEDYRGYYSDLSQATEEYLKFVPELVS